MTCSAGETAGVGGGRLRVRWRRGRFMAGPIHRAVRASCTPGDRMASAVLAVTRLITASSAAAARAASGSATEIGPGLIVGEAEDVAPGIVDFESPAGGDPERWAKRRYALDGQLVGGGSGVRDLEPDLVTVAGRLFADADADAGGLVTDLEQ